MSHWYAKVSKDIAHLPSCIDHYYSELDQARGEVKVYGNIEKASSVLPGIVEQRFNQLQEIEAILEYLNIELRRLRSKTFKKFLENYQRALSSRDVEKYVEGEPDVVDMEKIINEFALLRNQWLGIIKGLDIKQWQLSNIIKLRTAGLEDASL
jgi:hypothetical protein